MSTIASELARRLHERSFLTGEFKLRSGVTAPTYLDKYLFEADPTLLHHVAQAMLPCSLPISMRWQVWSSATSDL